MTGRMVRQKVAVRIVFLKPCRCVICSLRISTAALAVAPYTLLIHVICFFVQFIQRCGIIAAACAGVFPLKLMNAADRYFSVFIQNADGRVIQSGHIPLKSVGNDLICIKSFYFQFLNLSDLGLKSDIECSVVLSISLSVNSVVGLAEMVGQSEEIKPAVVCQSRHLSRRIRFADYSFITEGRSQHIFKGHIC